MEGLSEAPIENGIVTLVSLHYFFLSPSSLFLSFMHSKVGASTGFYKVASRAGELKVECLKIASIHGLLEKQIS
jgi:hypothetical protein